MIPICPNPLRDPLSSMDVGEVQAGPWQRHGSGVWEDRSNVGYDDEEDDQVEGNDIGSSQQSGDKNSEYCEEWEK